MSAMTTGTPASAAACRTVGADELSVGERMIRSTCLVMESWTFFSWVAGSRLLERSVDRGADLVGLLVDAVAEVLPERDGEVRCDVHDLIRLGRSRFVLRRHRCGDEQPCRQDRKSRGRPPGSSCDGSRCLLPVEGLAGLHLADSLLAGVRALGSRAPPFARLATAQPRSRVRRSVRTERMMIEPTAAIWK